MAMSISILDLIRAASDSELIIGAATLGGVIYGIYAIYRKRETVFFRYDEINKAVQLGFLINVMVSMLAAIIPGLAYRFPGGIDLPTAITLAVVVGLTAPPLIALAINKMLYSLHKRGWLGSLSRVLKFWCWRKVTVNLNRRNAAIADVLIEDEDIQEQTFAAIGARNRFERFLKSLERQRLIAPETRELIMAEYPEIPDLGLIQQKLDELKRERAEIEKSDVYQLRQALTKTITLVKHYKDLYEREKEMNSWKARLPRDLFVAALGVAARQAVYALFGI